MAAPDIGGPKSSPIPSRIGPYEILGELGRGGSGTVYRARNPQFDGHLVALKLLQVDADADARRRLEQEAEILARLRHPNVVKFYHTGDFEGRIYIVCEFIEGRPVDCVKPMAVEEAVRIAAEVARALAYAHKEGVFHRDVTPRNILLEEPKTPGEARHVVLVDFGLSKVAGARSITVTGETFGTIGYVAPEMLRPAAKHDARTDVFGLGAVLYKLLAGRPPWDAADLPSLARAIEHELPARPSCFNGEVDRDLDAICLTALKQNPQRRYQTALEFASELSAWQCDQPISARLPGPLVRLYSRVRRLPTALVVSFVLPALALAAIGGRTSYLYLSKKVERRLYESRVNAVLGKWETSDGESIEVLADRRVISERWKGAWFISNDELCFTDIQPSSESRHARDLTILKSSQDEILFEDRDTHLKVFFTRSPLAKARASEFQENRAVAKMLELASANERFRNEDADANGVHDYWVGDVAGLFTIAPLGSYTEEGRVMRKFIGLINLSLACADAAPLKPETLGEPYVNISKCASFKGFGPTEGYWFAAMKQFTGLKDVEPYGQDTGGKWKSGAVYNLKRFGFCAYPAMYPKTGAKTFIIGESRSVYARDTGGTAILVWPSEVELQRYWSRAD